MHEPHKLASLLPAMKPKEYDRLKDDIKANGLLDPITLYEDKTLDGIHRERICDELGVEARYTEFDGDDPARFVVSKNLARRHLTTGQLAMVGVELAKHFEGKIGRPKKNSRRPAGVSRRDNEATEKAAKVLGTSGRSITRAKRIKAKRPDLAAKVEAGEMAVNAADEEIRTNKRKTDPPKPKKGQPRWSGKRLRELRGSTGTAAQLQKSVAKAVQELETFEFPDIDWDEPMNSELFGWIFDDLGELKLWLDIALATVTVHLNETDVRRKIKKLQAVANDPNAGHQGSNALRLIEVLRTKKQLNGGEAA